ncbi:MAG: SDR family oxidoreductase [Rhodospirillaceae bacterium]|nr:SDR family oxidoreductase [Rhodospirillaceae bacterium]
MSGKVVVVTGSTKGIGRGLAREFIKRGHSVVVSGRTQAAVDEAVADVSKDAVNGAKALGVPCDVIDYAAVQKLWDKAVAAFGRVDIWINNAGMSNSRFPIGHLLQDEVEAVPRTNLVGTLNGSHVALKGMKAQSQINGISGDLYNFEGFGSNGSKQRGMSLYGCTKFAITYFTKCLIAETKGGAVRVGYLSPGIVITDLSVRDKTKVPPKQWAFTIMIYNILADRVETVTPWLVENVLANTKHGARIAWLTRGKSLWRFLKSRFVKPGDRFPELHLPKAA